MLRACYKTVNSRLRAYTYPLLDGSSVEARYTLGRKTLVLRRASLDRVLSPSSVF